MVKWIYAHLQQSKNAYIHPLNNKYFTVENYLAKQVVNDVTCFCFMVIKQIKKHVESQNGNAKVLCEMC